jgi:hypothetical protein
MISNQLERKDERASDGPQRVFDHLLSRDAQRHPWGGTRGNTTGERSSGYYLKRDRPGPDGKGYCDNPDDERSGGNAGVVGRDERLRP